MKNKLLGVWLRKSKFVAGRGLRGLPFQLGGQAEIQGEKKVQRLYRKFLDINFYCQLTEHEATFFRELMESGSKDR